jgi:hypothetical protein
LNWRNTATLHFELTAAALLDFTPTETTIIDGHTSLDCM